MSKTGFLRMITPMLVSLLILNLALVQPAQASPKTGCRIYVGGSGGNSNHSGLSWLDAVSDLQDGINKANIARGGYENICEAWVAGGAYMLQTHQGSFVLTDFINLYGGFAGGETDISQRHWREQPSILQGNGWHVLEINYVYAGSLVGFTITGGQATTSDTDWGVASSSTVVPRI
jgi:hypothetical protein